MKKAPPNRTGKEIWRDMVLWDAQRRQARDWDGKTRTYNLAEYLEQHQLKGGREKD